MDAGAGGTGGTGGRSAVEFRTIANRRFWFSRESETLNRDLDTFSRDLEIVNGGPKI